MRTRAVFFVLAAGFCWGARVDPSVWEAAQRQTHINVFLRMKEQPHAEAAERISPARLEREVMEGRYQRLTGHFAVGAADFAAAARELERATVVERVETARWGAARMATEQEGLEERLRRMGARRVLRYEVLNLMRVELPVAALKELEQDEAVAEVALVGQLESQINTSVRSLGAPYFWNGSPQITGLEQVAAMLDSGVTPTHPALTGRVGMVRFLTPGSINCVSADDYTDSVDHTGHGTHVAGIIMGGGATLFPGYLGVAFQAANLFSVKVGCKTADSLPPFYQAYAADDDLLQGLQYIVLQTPAKVVNISMGRRDRQEDSLLNRTIDSMAELYGLTIVVSAGNLGPGAVTLMTPGTAYNVITVGAFNTQGTETRTDDLYAGFTSRGPTEGGRKKPDVAAPGGRLDAPIGGRPLSPCPDGNTTCGIYSTDFAGSGFVPMVGTSMAAAHVTGSAMLLRQAGVTNPLAIKALLLNSTDTADWSGIFGWGYVNLQRMREQMDLLFLDKLAGGAYHLYRANIHTVLTGTVVWNRKVSARGVVSLSDLDLSMWAAGLKTAESASRVDNVEKTSYPDGNGAVVVKVRNSSAAGSEEQNYALSLSLRGFAKIGGPQLTFQCDVPYAVEPASSFAVVCAGRNTGDADALDAKGMVGYQGQSAGTLLEFGKIAVGERVTRTYTLTAPAVAGSYVVEGVLASVTYGETFSATTTAPLVSTLCTYGASASVTSFAAAGGTGTLTVATQSGCPTVVTSQSAWITVNGTTFVVAANSGGPRTGSIFVSGEVVQVLQRGVTSSAPFDDVPADYPFADYISLVRTNGVTGGCGVSTYCPGDNTTRGQMSAFIIRSVLKTDTFVFPQEPSFNDVAGNHPFFKYIQKMKESGITTGCSAVQFCPDTLLSRGAMAVFIVRGRLGLAPGQGFSYKAAPYFDDVTPAHPFYAFIQKMREMGITSGCGARTYCAEDWTTRGQMSVFLIRGFYTP